MHAPPPRPRAVCRIGPLTLDPQGEVLLRDRVPLPLGRRAVGVMLRLVRTPGEIVGKDELYAAVWQDQAVEESNLTVQISQLRRVLRAEVPGGDGWIETLARRGYRFIGPVAWQPAEAAPSARPAPPALLHTAALSNVPVAVPLHFTGREDALARLRVTLATPADRPTVVALHGLRGVGKTILAAAYARTHRLAYRVTWWLRAETVPTLRADLAAFAVRLGWARPDAAEDAACAAALDGMRREGDGLLLIFDNVEGPASLRPFLPLDGAAHVLVTSNSPNWRAHATPHELDLWPAEIGAGYLVARTGRTAERDDAVRLSAVLDGLPLAHEQAAAYVECLDIPFAEYLRRFDASPRRLLDDAVHAPAEYHEGLTVAKAFHLAIEQAGSLHPAAEPLLRHSALLAAEPIPVAVFRDARACFGEALADQLAEDGLDEALAVLRGFALVTREVVQDERDPALRTDCLRLHRLVRQVAASSLTAEAAVQGRATLIAALAAVYPPDVHKDLATWPRARRLDAIAMALVAAPAAIPDGAERAAAALLDRLASFRHGALAAFGQARPLFERAHALAEASAGPAHPFTAQTLNNLGLLLRDHGELAAALPPLRQALAIREAVFGPDHPETAISLNNLSNVIHESGDYQAARPLKERTLAIWEATYGERHFLTARAVNNLSRLLHHLGELAASEALALRALAIRETVFGDSHPDTANSLNNIALLQIDLDRPGQACALAERAVGIAAAALGPDHPETAAIRGTLARCLLAQGAPAEALAMAERALAVLSSALAPNAQSTRAAAAVAADCRAALARSDERPAPAPGYGPRNASTAPEAGA